jgi:hypothetical protein
MKSYRTRIPLADRFWAKVQKTDARAKGLVARLGVPPLWWLPHRRQADTR